MLKKKIGICLLIPCLVFMFTGCGGSQTSTNENSVEISIEGKTKNDLTGFAYLCDYGDGYSLYADKFTKIVYISKSTSSGSGAKATATESFTPWISKNGNYYYIDTDAKMIKELNANYSTDENITSQSTDEKVEESGSVSLDPSITNQINQNQN